MELRKPGYAKQWATPGVWHSVSPCSYGVVGTQSQGAVHVAPLRQEVPCDATAQVTSHT